MKGTGLSVLLTSNMTILSQAISASRSFVSNYFALIIFYLLYFGIIGGFQPYYPEYLKHLGFNEIEIGQLVAISNLIKLGIPFYIGYIAKTRRIRIPLIRFCTLISAVFYLGFYCWADNYWGQCLVMFSYGSFWAAVMPLLFSATQIKLKRSENLFGVLRVFGTLGYLIFVFITGFFMSYHASNLIHVMGVATLLLAIASLTINEKPVEQKQTIAGAIEKPKMTRGQHQSSSFYVALIVTSLLIGLAHGPLFTLGSLYFNELGYTGIYKSCLWAISMVAEITFLLVSAWLLHKKRITIRSILLVSVMAAAARWFIMAYSAASYPMMCLGQALHAFTFAGTELSFVYLAKYATDNNSSLTRLNTIIFCAGQGLGSPLGCWLAGMSWKHFGFQQTFAMTGLISIMAWIIVFFGLKYQLADPAESQSAEGLTV